MRSFQCAPGSSPLTSLCLAAACSVAATSAGCSEDGYAVAASWLINGLPPDEASCTLQGVQSVRLTVSSNGREQSLEADCAERIFLSDGFDYGGFITNESFDYDRNYTYQVDMLDARGEVIAGYNGSFRAEYGDFTPVELPPLELFQPIGDVAALVGSFAVGAGPLSETCALAGIDAVELWMASATDLDFVDPVIVHAADCEAGEVGSDEAALAYGDYQVKYVAVDKELNVLQESEPFALLVDGEALFTLDRVTFSVP
jgi:hypothetical protein